MRVRLERYEMVNRTTTSRSTLAFVFGGLGLVFFGFITFVGLLMILMPDREGGGIWAVRSGILLFIFLGAAPLVVCALVITWGVKQRTRFRRLGELAAIARQTPLLTVPQVSHALRLSLAEADRLVLDASSLGLIEPGDPAAYAATVAQWYPPSPLAVTPTSEPPRASAPPIRTGTVLGEAYRIEEPLGRGGMGAVYAARHLRTGRRYAVKTMLAGGSASEEAIRRFEREATAASALGHPGIVQVHDFNVAPGGLFYLVMDLLEGETLERRMERAALPWAEAQRIAIELCAGLGAAHEHGLLHRDIKPSNIFLARAARSGAAERVVLVDFGLVKSIAESSIGLTSTGAVVGTPMYMSPEQARGEPLDVRSDLYSLAAVIFEAATGAPPFLDRTMASVYARLLNDPPPRASHSARKGVPRAVDDVLVRALAKDRAARYPTARELGEALAGVREEAAPVEAPTTERMSG